MRERNINVWLPLSCPLLRTWPATQACALTGNWTDNPLVHRPVCSPLSHTSQSQEILIYRKGLDLVHHHIYTTQYHIQHMMNMQEIAVQQINLWKYLNMYGWLFCLPCKSAIFLTKFSIYVQFLAQCLAHSRYSVNGSLQWCNNIYLSLLHTCFK